MLLVSVSGSADDLAVLTGDAGLLDSRATMDSDDQWTVVGYADEDLTRLSRFVGYRGPK
jgi:hypothetical protein